MTNAPPDDPRLAEIRAALARVAERDRTTRPGVIEDYVSYGRSTLDDLQYVADQLDAARATIAGVKRAFEDLDGLDLVEPHLAQYACDLCERLRDSAERNDRQALRLYNLESQLAAREADTARIERLYDLLFDGGDGGPVVISQLCMDDTVTVTIAASPRAEASGFVTRAIMDGEAPDDDAMIAFRGAIDQLPARDGGPTP